MQFLYVYWSGAQGDELRWSMRSVHRHFVGAEPRVIVIGDRAPYYTGPFLRRTRVGPCERRSYRDVLNKIHAACRSDHVDDTFVWMMDDIYFLKDITLEDLSRHYRGGKLPARYKAGSGGWVGLKADTFRVIKARGLPLVDYCTHLPHVLEKEKWLWLWRRYDLGRRVLQWELLYGAEFFREHCPVRLIRTRVTKTGAVFDAHGKIGNNSNHGWSPNLLDELRRRFPVASPWETPWETPDCAAPLTGLVADVYHALGIVPRIAARETEATVQQSPTDALDRICERHGHHVTRDQYHAALAVIEAAVAAASELAGVS